MQIVIDIPEKIYKEIMYEYDTFPYPYYESFELHKAIRNGTPLPEGHGNLIDYNALDKDFEKCTCAENCGFLTCPVYSQKVIIEADKEE